MPRLPMLAFLAALVAAPAGQARGETAAVTSCSSDGQQVTADSQGDVSNPELDIVGVSMAEHGGGPYAGKFMVTLQVRQLASPQPASSGLWTVSWKDATGQNTSTVSMSACNGVLAFHYDYQTPDGTGSQSGVPDAGATTADGRIQIVLSRDKFGDPPPGALLTQIGAVTDPWTPVPPAGCVPNLGGQDVSEQPGTYTMGSCVLAVMPPALATGVRLGPPLPNPARAGVHLALDVPAPLVGSRAVVSVFDAGGRIVRALHRGAVEARMRLEWDLRAASGARVPPGSYWIGAEVGGAFHSQRVEVLR